MKNIRIFYLKIFIFFCDKILSIFEYACFRNVDRISPASVTQVYFSSLTTLEMKFNETDHNLVTEVELVHCAHTFAKLTTHS